MPKSRRSYDREVKIEAVRLATRGDKTTTQVARDLGINSNNLARWKRDLTDDPGFAFPAKGKLKPADEDLRRLNKELRDITEECDILKKPWPFSLEPRSKWRFIEQHRDYFRVGKMEEVLHLSRSGYYAAWKRPTSCRER
jgi:transposase